MSKQPEEVKALVNEAVQEAIKNGLDVTNETILTAIRIGAAIGAAVGADVGAKATAMAMERERKKIQREQYDKRLHNTKLLLRHYRSLNEHYRHAVYDSATAREESEDFTEIMEAMNRKQFDESLYIESIKQSVIRTKVIMAHVNKMLDVYERLCHQSKQESDKRHWRVLHAIYLVDEAVPLEAVAERESIDKRTIYKDIDACVEELTVLFFGISGIDKS